jgi:carbonic anhydrase/acetyltransferase-like protein (isoleucine patch superfamily)
MPGVTIGHGAVVGAYSIVTRDVRPFAIVAGNPAREIRRRFSDAEIDALLVADWWHWPHEEVMAIAHVLTSPDVGAIIAYAAERATHS